MANILCIISININKGMHVKRPISCLCIKLRTDFRTREKGEKMTNISSLKRLHSLNCTLNESCLIVIYDLVLHVFSVLVLFIVLLYITYIFNCGYIYIYIYAYVYVYVYIYINVDKKPLRLLFFVMTTGSEMLLTTLL